MKKKILVSVPTSPANPFVHKQFLHIMVMIALDRRYIINLVTPSCTPSENTRSHILNHFIESDYDYWLSMDADNPPSKNPLDLVELDKDIIGLPTPVWKWSKNGGYDIPITWNAYTFVKEHNAYKSYKPKIGLQQVDAIGFGCFIVSKRLFEHKEMKIAPFMRKWHQDGTVWKGLDIAFCERLRKYGFEIWTHFDYFCHHIKYLDLHETNIAFSQLFKKMTSSGYGKDNDNEFQHGKEQDRECEQACTPS